MMGLCLSTRTKENTDVSGYRGNFPGIHSARSSAVGYNDEYSQPGLFQVRRRIVSTTIFIGNLPSGTSVEEIRQELTDMGAPLLNISQVEAGDPDRLTFAVELDIDHHTAQLMVGRRKERHFKGRQINIFVPTL